MVIVIRANIILMHYRFVSIITNNLGFKNRIGCFCTNYSAIPGVVLVNFYAHERGFVLPDDV